MVTNVKTIKKRQQKRDKFSAQSKYLLNETSTLRPFKESHRG